MPHLDLDIIREGAGVRLCWPHWSFHLKTDGALRARRWDNHLTGRSIGLGDGLELGVELDAAKRRLWIEGWRGLPSQVGDSPPDREAGLGQGYHRPEFDDSAWQVAMMPGVFCFRQPHVWYWARTHLFLPADCRGQDLTLVLGGLGLYDYRYTRVFINGRAVATRRVGGCWHEPGRLDIGPRSPAHRRLRFGQDNVIALQLARPICRTRKLDRFDRHKAHHLPWPWVHPGQYEQYVAVGTPTVRADLRVRQVRPVRRDGRAALEVTLRDRRAGLEARVVYHADPKDPVLRRCATLRNIGRRPLRVMDIRLGDYRADAPVSEGYMGFPVYIGGQFFATLAHPAGWALGQAGHVSLRQYAGVKLEPGRDFECMEAVLGVSQAGQARQAFVSHLQGRMRRVVRCHDKPLAIFETFGGWELERPDLVLSENLPASFCLDMAGRLERFRRQTGQQFDLFGLEFWADPHGDLRRFHPANFPRGFGPLRRKLKQAGIAPGLWITSSTGGWNIGRNPVVANTRAENPSYPLAVQTGSLCMATDPLPGLLADALVHHVTRNGVRMVKIDGHHCVCYNTSHDHLPGLYSTQAIYEGTIRLLRAIDRACPDVFMMLYWGHGSPWWLLYADTLCESGLHMEGASPSSRPAPYARDAVTVSLDQAQEYGSDVPALGKDSLGIWLSDWHWNSHIGPRRWAQGLVMDLARGSLLLQPWTDRTWLTPPDRRQFARLLGLLRERPECFRDSRRILGSAWRQEPYGYCCTDGERAFVAISNPTWRDARVRLRLDDSWGLTGRPGQGDTPPYDLYRHYPAPARLEGWRGRRPGLLLRPFEVVLLEALPQGRPPSGSGRFPRRALPDAFSQASLDIPLQVRKVNASAIPAPTVPAPQAAPPAKLSRTGHRLIGRLPAIGQSGTLVVCVELSRAGQVFAVTAVDCLWAQARLGGRERAVEPVLTGKCYPAPWQAWRMDIRPSPQPVPFEFMISSALPRGVELAFAAHFVPKDGPS